MLGKIEASVGAAGLFAMTAEVEALCSQLGALTDSASRSAFLDQWPQLLDRAIVTELDEAVRQKVRTDMPEALRLADAAIVIAERLGDDEALAFGSRAKGNALHFVGQSRPAVELFLEAARLFERAGNGTDLGRTLSSSIQPLILLGEYETAFSTAEKARQIFASRGEGMRLARLEINVANIHHRQNHFAEALVAYESAYQQLLPYGDCEGIGVALHNLAVCRIAMDDFPGALETYQRIRTFFQSQDMPLLLSQAEYNIAYLHYLRGDYTEALDLLRATRETCRKNGDSYHLALCDLDQSEIYLELRMVDEAAEMAGQSFDQFQQLGITFEAARSLSNLAVACGLQGDNARSLELLAQAKEMLIREKNQAWPFLLDLYQALVLFKKGDIAEARRLCNPARDFFASNQMRSKQALCVLLLARICQREGDLKQAAQFCQDALQLVEKLDSRALHFQVHFLTGQVHESAEQPAEAWTSYQASRAVLETLRSSLDAEELKISFMNDKVEVYARLVQLSFDRGGPQAAEDAFAYIEEAKSRGLRDLLFERMSPHAETETDASPTGVQLRELRKELNWFYRRIEREQLSQDGAAPEVIQLLQTRALSHERELLRLSREISPHAAGKLFRNSGTATLDEIRASLPQDAALVEYFAIGERLLAAVLTSSTLDFLPVESTARLNERLRLLQFQMSKFRLGAEYVKRFGDSLLRSAQGHLEELYRCVMGPLRRLLEGKRHLVIVPYGGLHALPFHALFDGNAFLIDNFTISYAPSASIYALCARDSGVNDGSSLVLGVEDPGMPYVRQEVVAVAGVLPSAEILWGAEATADALQEKGRHSKIIHIAAHGSFRQDNPMFSAVKLADSHLSLYDLYHMDLPAELLTLSGCVTGLSVMNEAEEPLGLARGLLFAGARSLLLSLWDVDDQSTADLMASFYSRLGEHRDRAQALREAMLDHRLRYPHPYYWAPFRLIGKTQA
jgi:CHAT domain-containing protein